VAFEVGVENLHSRFLDEARRVDRTALEHRDPGLQQVLKSLDELAILGAHSFLVSSTLRKVASELLKLLNELWENIIVQSDQQSWRVKRQKFSKHLGKTQGFRVEHFDAEIFYLCECNVITKFAKSPLEKIN
jgi:hypothetical protein